ncbi:energy-coupling factor transporter ATPase [Collinsella sp. An2]|uniref:ABC transporter ATP-binding protein n=1 Tax=Collinsella sp. An2 TaxID=1965585 RepID=UPI000B369DB1|nr:energy-coupling factor transporter ATPase [Collinsella sp. An2]OUP07087.1 ABC transporter ATP-binding protein [Collinsella sp. An2]
MQDIIDIDHVSFAYAEAPERSLNDITLGIAPGEFLGIIGPSGAGKSTLCSALSGAIPHHYAGEFFGAVRVDGQDTCDVSLTDIARTVGSVLQDIDAQMVASVVEDEMLFGLENFGVPHDEIPGRVSWALETVGIADLVDREIATLSGGQKQKVAIAAILALQPRVLVLDEPTAALDPESSRAVFETLRRINQSEGITVVVVEQKVALLSEYCERVAVMHEGRVELVGTPAQVFSHTEELRRIGVDSPRTVRVSNSLAAAGLCPATPCLTVNEAARLIEGLVTARGADREVSESAGSTSAATTPSTASAASAAAAPAESGRCAPATSPRNAAGQDPIVTFDDVTFSYPGGGASVNNLTFSLYPGETLALIGQNGAGKTTATKLLNGLLKPSSGHVTVAGLDTRTARTSQIARHVATLFQDPDHQICKDTVLDEIAFGLELAGVSPAEARGRARVAAERFGLPLDEPPFSLSRGQRQMVALASVIVVEPEVIVLDEPTSGLDYRECMTVMETVSQMAQQGTAVLMVCHDMEVVSDFADRAMVMANGRIQGSGATLDVFTDPDLMRAACIAPPQVIELTERLARTVSPALHGVSEVADVARMVKELVQHG